MEFDKRLQRAIVRGKHARNAEGRRKAAQALSKDELKTLHSKCRLDLSEHIEDCLRRLADHFPGFDFQTIVGEDGWGAKINRDDFQAGRGRQAENLYSRLEMVIRPFSSTHIVELAAKGTVRNKEIFNRTHYQFLSEYDRETFQELIDLWVLEYAEQYTARS